MTVETPARALHGRLRLQLAPGRDGRTRIAAAERAAPLQVQRPLFLEPCLPRLATIMLLNGTAGLFAGDRLSLEIAVASGAAAAIGTPAMTRVFAMPDGEAVSTVALRVASGAYLEYLPEPTLLCAAAALRQQLTIDVEPGGCLVAGDLLAFGRAASGEGHAYRSLDQTTGLRVGDALLLVERLIARGVRADTSSEPCLLQGYAAYGALQIVCHCQPVADTLARLRALLSGAAVYAAASLTDGDAAITVRLLGDAASPVRNAAARVATVIRERHAQQ